MKKVFCESCGNEIIDPELGCNFCQDTHIVKRRIKFAKERNMISLFFNILGWFVICVGVICGLLVIALSDGDDEAVVVGIAMLIAMPISSLALFAVSEIIQILHDIRRKLYEKK